MEATNMFKLSCLRRFQAFCTQLSHCRGTFQKKSITIFLHSLHFSQMWEDFFQLLDIVSTFQTFFHLLSISNFSLTSSTLKTFLVLALEEYSLTLFQFSDDFSKLIVFFQFCRQFLLLVTLFSTSPKSVNFIKINFESYEIPNQNRITKYEEIARSEPSDKEKQNY